MRTERIILSIIFLISFCYTGQTAIKSRSTFINFIPDQSVGTSRMSLSANGLGIGVSDPTEAIDVSGNMYVSGNLTSGNIEFSGALYEKITYMTADGNLDNASLIYTDSANAITLTLPAAETDDGRAVTVKNLGSSSITIASSSNIDGSAGSLVLSNTNGEYPYVSLVSSGNAWHITGSSNTGSTQSDASTLGDNLWAWYKLDEAVGTNVTDSGGSGRDATHTNMAAGNIGVAGKVSLAAFTDGVDDYIQTPTSNMSTNTMTIAAWVNVKSFGAIKGLIMSVGGTTRSGIHLSGSELRYHWNNDASSWGVSTGLNLTADTWEFVAISVAGSHTTIYLNGSSYVNTFEHVVEAFDAPFYIGVQNPGTRLVNAIFDQVYIYERALSSSEINLLYQLQTP